MSYFILGSTGLCGSNFLNTVLRSPEVSKVFTVSRRQPTPATGENKLSSTVEKDTSKWPSIIESLEIPKGSTFFSGFGITTGAAGSAENFIKIDHGIAMDAFKAAKSAKFDTAVLISSGGANPNSRVLYWNTKGKIEEDLKALKFKRTIILRPGAILGRAVEEGRPLRSRIGAFIGITCRKWGIEKFVAPIYGEEVAKLSFLLSQKPIGKEGEIIVINPVDMLKMVRENNLSVTS